MARQLRSQRQKRLQAEIALEAKLTEACDAVWNGSCKNVSVAARQFGVSYHTLRRRVKRLTVPRGHAHKNQETGKKEDLFSRISEHFERHPQLKLEDRFKDLFLGPSTRSRKRLRTDDDNARIEPSRSRQPPHIGIDMSMGGPNHFVAYPVHPDTQPVPSYHTPFASSSSQQLYPEQHLCIRPIGCFLQIVGFPRTPQQLMDCPFSVHDMWIIPINSSLVMTRSAVTNHPQLRSSTFRSVRSCSTGHGSVNQSASKKLFMDAAREEAEENDKAATTERRSSRLAELESRHRNWTGEESMQDAVLRMLVDKYKPDRSHWPIRTADQKLKESPPQIRGSDDGSSLATTPTSSWQEIADMPLLPSIEGHKPWHTTFKAPSQVAASIKLGNFAPSSARSSAGPDESYEHTKRTERELAKRKQQVHRLSDARESTLDYQLGLRGGFTGGGRASSRRNPVSLKGWQSLIEERIEKARLSGQFDKVEGRGGPFARLSVDCNPFIAREEFLMNRIVQRNGAAPPWVEIQMELEASVNAFRETLRESWTRRATRMLAIAQPSLLQGSLSSSTLPSLRDQEWEEQERSYHDAAIAELNSLVRKYNAIAPYAVRRAYYSRDTELVRAYRDSEEGILRRSKESKSPSYSGAEGSTDGPQGARVFPSIWDLILQWTRTLSRWFNKR